MYRDQLYQLKHINIPLWFGGTIVQSIQYNRFYDASMFVYAAVVYC